MIGLKLRHIMQTPSSLCSAMKSRREGKKWITNKSSNQNFIWSPEVCPVTIYFKTHIVFHMVYFQIKKHRILSPRFLLWELYLKICLIQLSFLVFSIFKDSKSWKFGGLLIQSPLSSEGNGSLLLQVWPYEINRLLETCINFQ